MAFHLKPDEVMGFAKHVYDISDDIGRLDIDGVLRNGSTGCAGIALATGLRRHATTEHEHVQRLAGDLDGSGQSVVAAVDAFVRLDSGTPTPTADRDT